MRLINTSTLLLENFTGKDITDIPEYATLSHTWAGAAGAEVSYKDMLGLKGQLKEDSKIRMACKIAADANIQYVWVDTCCIDKSNSTELSEAIKSMYNWYRQSKVCYAFLFDLEPDGDLGACRWFSRGWTLQELIAPKHVVFYSKEWNLHGTKRDLVGELSRITGISEGILLGDELSAVSIAQKMSWAAGRKTTRVEDIAYCLLGIFDINMPLLYGEGHRAFRRLQEVILLNVHDLSIFAWRRTSPPPPAGDGAREYCGVLADSPSLFETCGSFVKKPPSVRQSIHAANGSITARLQLFLEEIPETGGYRYFLPLDCSPGPGAVTSLAVHLRKYGSNDFVRENPSKIWEWEDGALSRTNVYKERHLQPGIQPLMGTNLDLTGSGTQNFIGNQRSHALQINLQSNMWIHVNEIWPGHRFDGEDRAFFLKDDPEFDSATIRLLGCVPPKQGGHQSDIDFECTFIALGWSSTKKDSPPQCSILDYRRNSAALLQLRSDVSVWDYSRKKYLLYLKYHKIPKHSVAVIQIPDKGIAVKVSFELHFVDDPTVCRNRFWRIQFSCEQVDNETWDFEAT